MAQRKGASGDARLPEDLLGWVLEGVQPAELPAHRHEALRRELMTRVSEPAAEGLYTTRAGQGTWQPIAEGVDAKVLHDDGSTRTWLARMDAGARLPPHFHEGNEECFVLEGSCLLGDEEMHRGDYQMAVPGSSHGEVFSALGCLLLVRSPTPRAAHP